MELVRRLAAVGAADRSARRRRRSLTYDWLLTAPAELVGNASVSLSVRASAPVAHLGVKLCDVFPDGTSALITRGMLNLTHRGRGRRTPTARPGGVRRRSSGRVDGRHRRVRGDDVDAAARPPAAAGHRRHRLAELLAAAGTGALGRRLAQRGADAADLGGRAGVGARVRARAAGRRRSTTTSCGGSSTTCWAARPGPRRATAVATTASMAPSSTTCTRARSACRPPTPGGRGRSGHTTYRIAWPEATCGSEVTLEVRSDAEAYDVTIDLTTTLDGAVFATRHWTERIPRDLQ